MKKIITLSVFFMSILTLMAVTGSFERTKNAHLWEEVMNGRTPGTLSNPGGSGSNQAPSGSSSQSSGDESQDGGDGGGDDDGGSTPSYDKPAVFGSGTSIGNGDITQWNDEGYITTLVYDGTENGSTYKINDLGTLGEWGQNEGIGYNGTVERSGYQFDIGINDSGIVFLHGANGMLFATDQEGWRNGELNVTDGRITQAELDAAKTIIEKVNE